MWMNKTNLRRKGTIMINLLYSSILTSRFDWAYPHQHQKMTHIGFHVAQQHDENLQQSFSAKRKVASWIEKEKSKLVIK